MSFVQRIVRGIRRLPLIGPWWRGRPFAVMDGAAFASGLGDSAWLLYALVRSLKPEVAVEIGSARGKSTCFIGQGLRENGRGRLFAIDPHQTTNWNDTGAADSLAMLKQNLRRVGVECHVEIVRMMSADVAKDWNQPIDLLLIDGDHSYEGVKRDWELFSPFVRSTGVVVFHDTAWELCGQKSEYYRADMGVPRFVESLREAGYPVVTLYRDCGVSLVQPVQHGLPLMSSLTKDGERLPLDPKDAAAFAR